MQYVTIRNNVGQRGNVHAPGGTHIGRVVKHRRVAAGANGQKRIFYTAEVWFRGAKMTCASLGTRHKTRAHAARAIRMFWSAFTLQNADLLPLSRLHASVRVTVDHFKWSQREVCALEHASITRPRYAY